MCEANVYMVDEFGKETLILEMVDKIRLENEKVYMQDIFGVQKTLSAHIKEMMLLDHKIILEKTGE